LSQDIWNDKT